MNCPECDSYSITVIGESETRTTCQCEDCGHVFTVKK